MTAPKRRWFRFSLRTLFVVLTVIGCWLGYQMNWMMARQQMRARDGFYGVPVQNISAPAGLSLLGEEGVGIVSLAPGTSEAEIDRARRLFPEAAVIPIFAVR